MAIVIREIDQSNAVDLYAVGALRYEVTVAEMHLDMRHADHCSRTIIEPLDYCGHVFGAYSDGELVGTMRQNLLKEAGVGDYYEAYGISQLPATRQEFVSVTTRLAVTRQYRNSRVSLLLPIYGYRFLLENSITHDVIDSRPNLLPVFKKLGYREHIETWGHPEFGDVVVQYLDVEDEAHLARVGSPFLSSLRKREKAAGA